MFCDGKTGKVHKFPKTEYDSVLTPFPLGVADNCKAHPTSRRPSKTMQNDNKVERILVPVRAEANLFDYAERSPKCRY